MIPQAPHINVELGMGGDLGGVEHFCPLEPLCLPYPPILNRGSGGASCAAGFGYIVHVRSPVAVLVAVACVIAIAIPLTVMVGVVGAAVGQLASRQVGN